MADSSELIRGVEAFVKVYMEQYQDSSHDWLHVERVRKIALKLAHADAQSFPEMEFDFEMINIAALLHDVGDFKYAKDGNSGPIAISNLLSKLGYPEDKVLNVIEIINNISYRHELEHGCSPDKVKRWNELTVVQDADRLESIGAIGVARCFAYNGRKHLPFYIPGERSNSDITAEEYNAQTVNNKGSARAHFDEKLVKVKGLMKSASGKVEAERRHKFMLEFMVNFDEDCYL